MRGLTLRDVAFMPNPGVLPIDPATLTTSVWYDASDAATITLNGSNVSQWNDKSGNARHLVQATPANQPAYTTAGQNGLNVVTFDGTDDRLTLTSFTLAQPFTIVAVGALSSAAAVSRQMLGTDGTTPALYHNAGQKFAMFAGTVVLDPGASDTSVHCFSALFSGASSTLRKDGTQVVASSAGTNGWTAEQLNLGATSSTLERWLGFIAEFIVFPAALSVPTQQGVEAFLKTKWATV